MRRPATSAVPESVDELGSPSSPSAGSDLAAAIGLRRRELGAFTALAASEDPLLATALGNAVGGSSLLITWITSSAGHHEEA